MVTTLVRKLMRDLARMRGQAVTIALVVACGIASYVTLQSAYASLLGARDAAYESGRLADVFVHLKRAPNTLLPRIEAIPGVAVAETRVVETVMLPMDDLPLPATGTLVGLPGAREPRLNAVFVREGRLPQAGHDEEVRCSSHSRKSTT